MLVAQQKLSGDINSTLNLRIKNAAFLYSDLEIST